MAAATILTRIQNSDPASEVVVLTATDAETYKSSKFDKLQGALIGDNNDTGVTPSVIVSGETATIQWTGVTDKKCTLKLWGHPRVN